MAEQEDDQPLLRARAAGSRREERRQRVDDLHQQRVVQARVDAERLQEEVQAAEPEPPRDRLRNDDAPQEPWPVAQDREAERDPLP